MVAGPEPFSSLHPQHSALEEAHSQSHVFGWKWPPNDPTSYKIQISYKWSLWRELVGLLERPQATGKRATPGLRNWRSAKVLKTLECSDKDLPHLPKEQQTIIIGDSSLPHELICTSVFRDVKGPASPAPWEDSQSLLSWIRREWGSLMGLSEHRKRKSELCRYQLNKWLPTTSPALSYTLWCPEYKIPLSWQDRVPQPRW